MLRLSSLIERREENDDIDPGLGEKPGGVRRTRPQRDRIRGAQGGGTERRGVCLAEKKQREDGGGSEGMHGRRRGRSGTGGEGGAGRWESRNGAGGEKVGGSGKEKDRRADAEKGCKLDAGKQGVGTRERGRRKELGGNARDWFGGKKDGARSRGVQAAVEKKVERSGLSEMSMRRGQSEGGGGRRGRERGDGVGDKKERKGLRPNSTGRVRAPQGHGLGYKKLEELSEKDPSEVAVTLSSHPAIKDILNETTMRRDFIELLCRVLSKAFQSQTDRAMLRHLAGMMKDSRFLCINLPYYLVGIESELDPVRRAQYPQHMECILALLSKIISMFSDGLLQPASVLLTQVQASITRLKTSGIKIPPQLEKSMGSLQGQIRHLQQRSRGRGPPSNRAAYPFLSHTGDNPDEAEQPDFRTIPIYPTPEELHQDQRPFLRPNLTTQCYTNTHLYLDTHFRLLREDFVGPIRDGIQQIRYQMNMGTSENPLKKKCSDDIKIYYDTKLLLPKCTHTGLAFVVQFNIKPLKFVRWQNSKRLIYGSLVLLSCDNFESFLFATVSERELGQLQKGQIQITFTEESKKKLAEIQIDQLFLMVESPAYFEAYRYVLDGLREQAEDSLPFQRYIVDCNKEVEPPAYLRTRDIYDLSEIAVPNFKKKRPFHSLNEKAWPQMRDLGLDASQMEALKLALTKELAIIQGPPGTGKTHVGLKIAKALLTNQGLWRDPSGISPMLVVCYTNHALDQFLEGIQKFLKNGIVRVGGRSDSVILKPFNMRELINSPNFKRTLPNYLRRALKEIFWQRDEKETEIQRHIKVLEYSLKGVLPESYLQDVISARHWMNLNHPLRHNVQFSRRKKSGLIAEWLCLDSTIHQQEETESINGNEGAEAMEIGMDLIEIAEEADLLQDERIIDDNIDPIPGRHDRMKGDTVMQLEEMMMDLNLITQAHQGQEGWEMQRQQIRNMQRRMQRELENASAMTSEEEDAVLDIWSISLPNRWRLYRSWVSRYRSLLFTEVLKSEEAYQTLVDIHADLKCHERLLLLQKAKVIGMTTTGAAKYRKILQEVNPCVVIVEEAAEVLEAHIITSLSQTCQHLILIGDHQQLRPSTTVYELAKYFNLAMSMFERLVNMGIPYVRLSIQHRMRPEIARLLTPHIYSDLENHPSVFDYESIKGINKSLFFVTHCHLEESIKDGTSHKNKHEAMFVVALCRYLLLQEYKPEQITILTTYTGQLNCLSNLMPAKEFNGVGVYVVDKYQGEENDIVLLSLVRSNQQGKVGFLSISNRVCVALSRAKKGLYCIGNSELLGQVRLWRNIFDTLKEHNQVGNALTLQCQNHPSRQVQASCAEDFLKSPEGGCTELCKFHLDCGHFCTKHCHPYDPKHKEYKCLMKCEKTICKLGHVCKRVCHEKCQDKCPVKVEKILPQCQHTQMIPCHQDPQTFVCQKPCLKLLLCSHPCDSLCGEPCTTKCREIVTLKLRCGHTQQDACFYKTEEDDPQCTSPCIDQLKCGHSCPGSCAKCYQGRFHLLCSHQCERPMICSHECRELCRRDCHPCPRPCENGCVHKKCLKLCGKLCVPCLEPCAWQCPHQSCSRLCHEPCDRPPCTQPCPKVLDCGHPCIGLCGDKCPNKCRICDREEVTELSSGTEDEAHFVQLEDCGHIFVYTTIDKHLRKDDNYQVIGRGELVVKLKECPKCRAPIRKNLRYGSHINRSLAEIEMVKMKMNKNQADVNGLQLGKICLSAKKEKITNILLRVSNLKGLKKETYSPFVDCLTQSIQFTDQRVFDLQRELQRLTLLSEINIRKDTAVQTRPYLSHSTVRAITKALEKPGQFTEGDQITVKAAMLKLESTIRPSFGQLI